MVNCNLGLRFVTSHKVWYIFFCQLPEKLVFPGSLGLCTCWQQTRKLNQRVKKIKIRRYRSISYSFLICFTIFSIFRIFDVLVSTLKILISLIKKIFYFCKIFSARLSIVIENKKIVIVFKIL